MHVQSRKMVRMSLASLQGRDTGQMQKNELNGHSEGGSGDRLRAAAIPIL